MLSFLLTVGLFSNSVLAETGEKLFQKKLCHTCHGVDGKTLYPNYPNLTGHDKTYIIPQFKDIKNRVRKNGLTILMNTFPTIKTTNDSQIKAIAEYLSELK